MESDNVCGKCSLQGRKRFHPEGDANPDFVLLCGFPTPEDVARGAFSSKNGMLLRSAVVKAIADLCLPVQSNPTYALAYTVQCAPPYNYEKKKFEMSIENVQCCSFFIRKWLDIVHPKAIVALGADAVKSLGIKEGIKDIRGSLLSFRLIDGTNVPLVPIFHIVNASKDPGLIPTLIRDIKKAAKIATDVVYDDPKHTEAIIDPNEIVERLGHTYDYIEEVYQKTGRRCGLALDTETTSLMPYNPNDRVIAVSLSCQDYVGFSYPFEHRAVPFSPEDFKRVFEATERLLSNPHAALLGCNGKFDTQWLKFHYGMHINDYAYDCQLGEHLLDEDKKGEYSLKDITRDRFPGLGNYEKEMTRLRNEIQEKLNTEWKKKEEQWKEDVHKAMLSWWVAKSEDERLSMLGA